MKKLFLAATIVCAAACVKTPSVSQPRLDADLLTALRSVKASVQGPQTDGTYVKCQDSRRMETGAIDDAMEAAKALAAAEMMQAKDPAASNAVILGQRLIAVGYGKYWACVRMVPGTILPVPF